MKNDLRFGGIAKGMFPSRDPRLTHTNTGATSSSVRTTQAWQLAGVATTTYSA
ncbi:MAG: hypothetical protein P8Y29_10440 [Gemmatimonadota bacterium]